MSFGAPIWFWTLLVIPVLSFLFLRAERSAAFRLRAFVSEKLLPNLARTVDRRQRNLRFALLLAGLALAIAALAQPQWGYVYEDTKRKGLDLILVVDTSRSMLSNDVPPNRLQRVKLAAQDLINELQGDRVGLIAFAGRAFLQAPLTIDYEAAVEAINDLDTNIIPEGGTNISEAIDLAVRTFGKSATGNRALIIFTDGEDLSGDTTKAARAATDAGVRIFTVGVGTSEGSLIPITSETGGTTFVKDNNGQIVKSRLDEKRLTEIATASNGFYLHLEDGPRSMKQLYTEGLAKMQAGDIDARLSRRPIERYQWPLGAAVLFVAASFVMRERRRIRVTASTRVEPKRSLVAAGMLFFLAHISLGAAPGLDAYRQNKFPEAYQEFEKTLQAHPTARATDKIQFDAGAAAYKMKDFGKALNSFSQALLSPDESLQSKSHYNLGNTLYQRGDTQKKDEEKLKDWTNALQHYEQSLRINPNNKEAKENLEFVKRKIEEAKQKRDQQQQSSDSKQDKNDKSKNDNKDQNQQSNQDQREQKDRPQPQQSDKSEAQQQNKETDQTKNESREEKNSQSKTGETPAPSPGEEKQSEPGEQGNASPSPSGQDNEKAEKEDKQDSTSKSQPEQANSSRSNNGNKNPSESAGQGQEENVAPTPATAGSPGRLAGDVKSAGEENQKQQEQTAQVAQAEPEKDGELSERQAELLLQSMKDEERRVQLDERKVSRRVYKDW